MSTKSYLPYGYRSWRRDAQTVLGLTVTWKRRVASWKEQEHFATWAKSFLETRQRSRWKETTDATNQAGYRGMWVTFQGIRIDTKLAAIQKL